jgi:hypothetical protein
LSSDIEAFEQHGVYVEAHPGNDREKTMRHRAKALVGGLTAVVMLSLGLASPAFAAVPNWTNVTVDHHGYPGWSCQVDIVYQSGILNQGTAVAQLHNSKTQLQISIPARDSGGTVGFTTTGWTTKPGSSSETGDFGGSSWNTYNNYDSDGSLTTYFDFPAASNGISSVSTYQDVNGYSQETFVYLTPNADGHCFVGQ